MVTVERSSEAPSALGARGIFKRYGPVVALDGVDFDANAGEVVGLVGDNGAGKSTLIKVLVGVVRPDKGCVTVDGVAREWRSSADARAAGIETCFQDLGLCDDLTIVRNFFLGKERTTGSLLLSRMKLGHMRRETQEALSSFGIDVRSVDASVKTLSGGERQSIAIARAVYFGARVLLLDEPTSALSVKETEKTLDAIREAVRRKIAVVLISHTLTHVQELADRVHVLQHGRSVVVAGRGELSIGDLENAVAGRSNAGARSEE